MGVAESGAGEASFDKREDALAIPDQVSIEPQHPLVHLLPRHPTLAIHPHRLDAKRPTRMPQPVARAQIHGSLFRELWPDVGRVAMGIELVELERRLPRDYVWPGDMGLLSDASE